MSERINKLYKPAEIEAAINILYESTKEEFSYDDAKSALIELHAKGWRLVKTS